MQLTISPATASRWDDVLAVFGTHGDPSRCWCSYLLSADRTDYTQRDRNRDQLRARVASRSSPGLLAYRDGTPVGWVAAAPRGTLGARLDRSPAMRPRPFDGDPAAVWAALCFVVPREHRGHGIAHALLGGAVAGARAAGAPAIEGVPRADRDRRWSPGMAYTGTASMFERAGFTAIDEQQGRIVYRLLL